jgi:hypothetical protein
MNAKHLIWVIPIVLIIGLAMGLLAATTIIIPENLTITMDLSDEANATVAEMQELAANMSASHFTYNLTKVQMDDLRYTIEEMGRYCRYSPKLEINNEQVIMKERTFCHIDNSSRVRIIEPVETYYLELGLPKTIFNRTLEIVGGSDIDGSIIMDIEGVRYTLHEGEVIQNNKLRITVEDLFIANMPQIYLSGNFIIEEI